MKNGRQYVILLLLAISVMYFFPWFSGNAESTVLASENIIRGTDIKKYTETLIDIAGSTMGNGVLLALKTANCLYIFPILALLSAVVLNFHKRYGYILSLIMFVCHLLFSLSYIFMPANLKELITLLFTTQPTIYLYGIFSMIGIVLSIYGLFTLLEDFDQSTFLQKTPPEETTTKQTKKTKKTSKKSTMKTKKSAAPDDQTVLLPTDFSFDETSAKKKKNKKTKPLLDRPRKKVSVSKKK